MNILDNYRDDIYEAYSLDIIFIDEVNSIIFVINMRKCGNGKIKSSKS